MSSYAVDAIRVVGVLFLVLLNAFFVAAEFALVTIRWTRVEELVAEGKFGAHAVREAVERLDRAIASTQLGITFASLALGWIGEPALAHLIQPLFHALPGNWSLAITHGAAVAVAFLIITYLHVVLGELVPKTIALERAEQVALLVAGPLLVFGRVFRPFIRAIGRSGAQVVKLLHLRATPIHQQVHSVDELSMLVEETQEAGQIPEDQATYVQNLFELSDKKVRDIMVPREKVVTVSLTASEEEILETARDTAHTRMPVWEGNADNIVGIVNTKDLFHLFSLRGLVHLLDAMYPPLFVEPEIGVAHMLRTFRRERRPMAVVKDNDGRFLGIVTLEDILEEIVGEIEDEHDVRMPHGALRRNTPVTAGAPATVPPRPSAPAGGATASGSPSEGPVRPA